MDKMRCLYFVFSSCFPLISYLQFEGNCLLMEPMLMLKHSPLFVLDTMDFYRVAYFLLLLPVCIIVATEL